MSTAIDSLKSTTFAGKRFTRKELAEIQQTVNTYRSLSLRELGHTVCEHLNWVTPGGKHRIQTCLNALEEMETAGLFQLPEKQKRTQKGTQKPLQWSKQTERQPTITGTLDQFESIRLELAIESEETRRFNEYIDRYHYLGYRHPIGNHLRYFIIGQNAQGEQTLGCLLFAFAVNALECRDQWIGWSCEQRKKHLPLVINNTRFLILPWVEIKNLASKALSIASHQVAKDWLAQHGRHPLLMETFVDPQHFAGTCYKAANWSLIGQSLGNTGKAREKTPKQVFVYPLHNDYRSILTQNRVWLKPTKKRTKTTTAAAALPELKEDDPFVAVWREVIVLLSNVANEFDAQWQRRRRAINTLLLLLFIFRLVFSKNKQGYSTTIVELWAQCHTLGVSLPQSSPVAASAFSTARKKLDEKIFKTLNTRIIATYEQSTDAYRWMGRRLFAVDGMKINLPRPLRHLGYDTPSANAHYPQGLVSCLYQLKSQIPYDFELASHRNERSLALSHLRTLRSGDVAVYDRGYYSYAMLYAHQQRGVDVIFRLARRSGKVIDAFTDSDQMDAIVTINVAPSRQQEVRDKNPGIRFTSIPLRLIKYVVDDTTYTLGTTLLDQKSYPRSAFPDLYHARWGIEELNKISKMLVHVNDFHAQTERGVKQELYAHYVLLTMNRMLTNHTETGLNANNKAASEARHFKVNVKNSLVTMARHLEDLLLQQISLTCETLNTVVNALGFCRQKKRPGRKFPRISRKPTGKWRPSKA